MHRLYNQLSPFLFAALLLVAVGCDGSPGADPTPEGATVSFATSGMGAVPADGIVEIPIEISNPQGEQVSVEVLFAEGASSATTEDVNNFGTATVTFSSSAESGAQETVEIDISDADITEGAIAAEFALQQASPEGTQIGSPREFTMNIGPLEIEEVRQRELESVVTTAGIVTRSHGGETRIQDETAGINIFDYDLVEDVETGDEILITGELGEYNGLLQLSNIAEASVISRDNPLPDAQTVTLEELAGAGDAYQSELIRVENLELTGNASGDFGPNENVNVTDGTATMAMFVSGSNSQLVGEPKPSGTFTYVGVAGHFGGSNQLYPVYPDDIQGGEDGNGDPGEPEEMTIAEARELADSGTEVIIEGIVTRIGGNDARIQDETGGLVLSRSSDFTDEIDRGDEVRVQGSTSLYGNLVQIDANYGDGNMESFEVLSSGNELPEPVELNSLDEVGEEHESQLVTIEGLQIVDTDDDTFQAGGGDGNYTVEDEGGNTLILRLDAGSYYEGEPIPEDPFTFTGAVGQHDWDDPEGGYQLMLIEEGDMTLDDDA